MHQRVVKEGNILALKESIESYGF